MGGDDRIDVESLGSGPPVVNTSDNSRIRIRIRIRIIRIRIIITLIVVIIIMKHEVTCLVPNMRAASLTVLVRMAGVSNEEA